MNRIYELIFLSMTLSVLIYALDSLKSNITLMDFEEYSIIATVVKDSYLQKDTKWFILSNMTTTFECDPPANTGLNINGSSGMRTQDQSPQDVYNELASVLTGLTPELFLDLMSKSEASSTINKELPITIKQVIWGPSSSTKTLKEDGNPDFAIYHSRVGFNKDRSLALVYVASVNWKDRSKSYGGYAILKFENSIWKILAKYRKWSLM